MSSITTLNPVQHGSVESRPANAQQGTHGAQTANVPSGKTEDAAVTAVPARQDRLLRDPEAASALANSIAGRLSSVGKDRAIEIQGNSRPTDVHSLLS